MFVVIIFDKAVAGKGWTVLALKLVITFACFKVDAVCFHTQRLVCWDIAGGCRIMQLYFTLAQVYMKSLVDVFLRMPHLFKMVYQCFHWACFFWKQYGHSYGSDGHISRFSFVIVLLIFLSSSQNQYVTLSRIYLKWTVGYLVAHWRFVLVYLQCQKQIIHVFL